MPVMYPRTPSGERLSDTTTPHPSERTACSMTRRQGWRDLAETRLRRQTGWTRWLGLRAEPERLGDLVAAGFDLGRDWVVLRIFAVEEVLGLLAKHVQDATADCCAVSEGGGELEPVTGQTPHGDPDWSAFDVAVRLGRQVGRLRPRCTACSARCFSA